MTILWQLSLFRWSTLDLLTNKHKITATKTSNKNSRVKIKQTFVLITLKICKIKNIMINRNKSLDSQYKNDWPRAITGIKAGFLCVGRRSHAEFKTVFILDDTGFCSVFHADFKSVFSFSLARTVFVIMIVIYCIIVGIISLSM